MGENQTRPRGLIFDMDGTIVDSVTGITASMNFTLKTFNRPQTDEPTVARLLGIPLARKFVELLGDLDESEADRFCAIYHDHYRRTCTQSTRLLPGVEPAVRNIADRSIPMAVATTKTREFTRLILDSLGCADLFPAIVGFEDVTHPKPHAEPLLTAAKLIGLPPADCVYVGDTPIDIMAAHAARMPSIGVCTGAYTHDELSRAGADWVFNSVGDIPAWLDGFRAA